MGSVKQSKEVKLLRERLKYFECQVKQTELAIDAQLDKEAQQAATLPVIGKAAKKLSSIKRYAMFNDVIARDRKRRGVTVYRDRAPRKTNPKGEVRPLSIKVEGGSNQARKLLRLLADRVTHNATWYHDYDGVVKQGYTVERFWFDDIPVGALRGK